ncbi:phosphonate ABC transporter, permease protein PhnE [Nocardia sp. NPDC058499]|uniref:phosphonate ABC transporter, permease protein PhnE n=1 Tax=Nocardia sp. NPDC058499 TaxID=3346530 RepID=UPI0036673EC4
MAVLVPPRRTGTSPRTLRPPSRTGIAVSTVLLIWLALSVWSVAALKINIATIADSIGNATDFIARIFPLDFPPLGDILVMTGQTLAIVTCATALSVVLSFGIALLAARNTTPGTPLRWSARAVVVVTRAIPEIVLAILFLRMFGLGGLAGILAMGIHSIGMVGKMYADAIEDTGSGPRDALRSAGATWWQQISGAVVPQAMPAFVATALHRFDINLRASVILGYVGVAGIGMELSLAMRTLDYQRGMALALFVVVLCIVVELLSGALRSALLGRNSDRGKPWWRRIGRSPWVTDGPARRAPGIRRPDGSFRISPPWTPERIRTAVYGALAVVTLSVAVLASGIDVTRMADGLGATGDTLALFFPPGTGGIWDELVTELLVTVQIALAATLLGLVVAVPVGILAARNVAPTAGVARFFRITIVVIRGIPDLIIAIIFIVVTGLGATAGALALSLGAVGLLGKLVADSLEETDIRVQQAVLAGGSTHTQTFVASTLRQSAPALVAHLFYQLDVNIRAATMLGVVGAGGIGFYLMNAARVMQFEVVTTIVLMVFAVVMLVEGIAIWMRRAMS